MYYYIEKNKNIILYDVDQKRLIESLKYRPDCRKEDVKQTTKKIIEFNGKNVFEIDVLEELLASRKKEKKEKMYLNCKQYIYSKYSPEAQSNISMRIGYTDEDFEKYKKFNLEQRSKASLLNKKIEETKTIEELEKINIEFKD